MGGALSYFISGLPRSRTAWLSVFMSQSGQYCHHDGFNGCHSIPEYKEKIKGCGDSSTGLTIIDLNREFPESKVVIIEKNELEFERCVKWCNQTYTGDSKVMLEMMRQKQSEIKGLRVKQYELDNRLRDIWEYLTEAPWRDRYLNLTKFNIQSDPFNIDLQAAKSLHASVQ